jgi:NAD+ diphosphatase
VLGPLALAREGLDRSASLRRDPAWWDTLWADPATRVLVVRGGRLPVIGGGGWDAWGQVAEAGPARIDYASPQAAAAATPPGALRAYLGRSGGVHYAAILVPEPPGRPEPPTPPDLPTPPDPSGEPPTPPTAPPPADEPVRWAGLRLVGAALGGVDASAASAAVALAAWHASARFCPGCGAATEVREAGWARWCPSEQRDLFPRTDPVVIMRVRDAADRILLERGRTWEAGRYSLPAGFVEAGEALEAAVVREVWEETGVRCGDARYLASQPWPFPRSLMCAFDAVATSTEITIDPAEVADARWWSRAELRAALADGTLHLAPRTAIARTVIEDWLERGGQAGSLGA